MAFENYYFVENHIAVVKSNLCPTLGRRFDEVDISEEQRFSLNERRVSVDEDIGKILQERTLLERVGGAMK